jgi:succinate-semialdehyde dehydrogenase/glutarate-semialdehyde dehydrogenase
MGRADDGATLAVVDPATGKPLASVPRCGTAETKRAIDAADAAWPAWKALTRAAAQLLQAWNG